MSSAIEEKQRTLIHQERLKAIGPYLQSLLEARDGDGWLEGAMRREKVRGSKRVGRPSIRDPRYLASLVGFDPVAGAPFSSSDRDAARDLTRIFTDLAHADRSWRPGSDRRAHQIVERLLTVSKRAARARTEPTGPDGTGPREPKPSASVPRKNGGRRATQPATTEDRLTRVMRLYSDERIEEALAVANEWIRRDRSSADAWSAKTACLHDLGDYEKAVDAARRWTSLEPENPWAWEWRLRALNSRGDAWEAGVDSARLAQERNSPRFRHLKKEVLDSVKHLIVLVPEEPAGWYWKAASLKRFGHEIEVLAACERWTALDPEDHNAWRLSTEVLRSLGRHGDAVATAERWLALQPGNIEALLWRIDSREQHERSRGAPP